MKKYLSIASLLVLLVIAVGCGSPLIVVDWAPTKTSTLLPPTANSQKSTSTVAEIAPVTPSSQAAKDATPAYTYTIPPAPVIIDTIFPTPTYTNTIPPTVTATQVLVATLKKYEKIISGPNHKGYFNIYPFPQGAKFEVLGISDDKEWFQVRLPKYENNGTGWALIASFDYPFDIQDLPSIKNPDTPTPGPTPTSPRDDGGSVTQSPDPEPP